VLEKFLAQKPLYYDEIDYARMPRIYESIKECLELPKIIHLIGTNGKGTTGRFLATALYNLGYTTGHYSSPHIVEFNERIWLNGENVADVQLEQAHQELLKLLSAEDAEALSYFEYTTLLAMLIYKACDYIVLEAGLGGEHDATAVFENILTVITPIGMDHEAFLGDTVEKIATTKLNAIKKAAVIGRQVNSEVYQVARDIADKKSLQIIELDKLLEPLDYEKSEAIAKRLQLSNYLQDNLALSIGVLKYLNIAYSTTSFSGASLFGRLSSLEKNILLDVGHNVLAAQKIVQSLVPKKYILVYNSYKDKNYREILKILTPIIEYVEIISVKETRIESSEVMQKSLEDLGYEYREFKEIKEGSHYLVFGSFSVVEAFLKVYHG